jgi:hypothetical protein
MSSLRQRLRDLFYVIYLDEAEVNSYSVSGLRSRVRREHWRLDQRLEGEMGTAAKWSITRIAPQSFRAPHAIRLVGRAPQVS